MCVIRTRCANPGTHPLKRHSWMFCFIRSGNSSSIFIEKSILEELLTLPPPSLPSYHTKTMNMMMWEENLQMAQHESGMWIATYMLYGIFVLALYFVSPPHCVRRIRLTKKCKHEKSVHKIVINHHFWSIFEVTASHSTWILSQNSECIFAHFFDPLFCEP